jgi:hypothetical protein
VKHSARLLISRRGVSKLILHALAALGLLSGSLQLVTTVWNVRNGLPQPGLVLASIALLSLLWGVIRALPRRSLRREFQRPDTAVSVVVGDLFAQDAHLVVGFADTFDTDTTDSRVIAKKSVQGQLLDRVYGGDRQRLDDELDTALAGVKAARTERPGVKQAGKLARYPIGTVALLGPPTKRVFAVVYTELGNDLIAHSSVDHLWKSLNGLWEAIYLYGQRERVAMPLIGAEYARINCLDRDSILKMLLLSFVARSREQPVCSELVITIHPRDLEKVNLLEVGAFLRTL